MEALAVFTHSSTAEFAVIIQDQERMLSQMMTWAQSDDEHLRRLASEGRETTPALAPRAGPD